MTACPNPECNRSVDLDGYFGPIPRLFYCECGRIYGSRGFGLFEVRKEEVDLSGLEGKYPVPHDDINRGLFIDKSRWKGYEKA